MTSPSVTVLMPAYNAGKYIAEAIRSVLQQHFSDFELLIINDGSKDDTIEIIQTFTDSRIRLINQSNQGIAAALNRGIAYANSSLIARFDADDICMPERLQLQYKFLRTHPDHVAVGCDAEYMTIEGTHLFNYHSGSYDHTDIIGKLNTCCPFIHSGVMFRKEAVSIAGGYFTDAHNFEDYLLWVRLSGYGKFANLPLKLIRVRFHPASVTIDEKWRGRKFRNIKRDCIRKGNITALEGKQLAAILSEQDTRKIKEASYYALCGKKYLVDNHQPAKARGAFKKAIFIYPTRFDNYLLLLLSFFPKKFIGWIYKASHLKPALP